MSLPPGERIAARPAAEGQRPDVVVEPDADRLARDVAAALVARLAAAQAVHGTARVVLTGGGIGTAVLERVADLAREPARERVDWAAVDVWWGDDRFVPAGNEERNELGARRALLDAVAVPAERVHAMPPSDAGFAEPEDAAAWYADQLAAAAPEGAMLPRFDVLLLGMGPEGHVASIFPGTPAVTDDRTVVAVRDCPKPPPTRISLGFPALNAAEEVWLLVSGAAKAPAVAQALTGGATPGELPAAGVHGRRATRWLIDVDAASELDREG
ncbi:6-phosphogluconolactonase [Geodermatophilus sp. DF01-2]|uniref:6-phosphogluconolactonase n=1 Tax=Geodermatophilus sp. DF01-2 TaxID=2559610 RepID=UPI0010737DAB|nr:6-phosphogluconolactonase [Geodermatophilus sp. DF01_2]TFV59322.1 6-phosphogluconolactonase [Geodermatophilus sp. DF01_2]